MKTEQSVSSANPQFERFNQLVARIQLEMQRLREEKDALSRENDRLKAELQELQQKASDPLSVLRDPERIALKNRINGLIARIDEHLKGT